MGSGGRRRRGRRRRRSYLGKVAHPPHPACNPGEEGRSLSEPGVVSSPLGESPSPPNWIFREWRAPSVCWRSERRGSALFHCLGTRKLRGESFPSPERPKAGSSSCLECPLLLNVRTPLPCEYWIGWRAPTPQACPPSLSLKSPELLRVCVWRGGGTLGRAHSVCLLQQDRPFLLLEVYSRARMGVFLSPTGVSSSPRPSGGKGLRSSGERGCSRPRARLRSGGAPEGGVFLLPALPELAWAAGSGRPRLPTPVPGYCGQRLL